jgi:predicted  nucleic acid-binding Zn-ribbon protein
MPVTKQLYELQEIDTEIENTRKTLDLKNGEVGKREELDAVQNKLAADRQALEELKHKRREAEAELDDTTSKIKVVEEQLYGGKINNPKELGNLQHEMNTLKDMGDQQETTALEAIESVEEAEKALANATEDFHKLEAGWQQQQKQLKADIESLNKALAELTERRKTLASQIDAPAVDLYEKVRQQKKQAVAKVEQGICRACRISLSASILQKARGGQPVQCGTCGRILFIS